ncbi:hypothetical protein LguiA_003490 [Lonicera macranthoides]
MRIERSPVVTLACGNPTEFSIIGTGVVEHVLQADRSSQDINWLVKREEERFILFLNKLEVVTEKAIQPSASEATDHQQQQLLLMTLWGTTIDQRNPYVLSNRKGRSRLRISQATLGLQSKEKNGNEKAVIVCKVGNGNPVGLCVLIPGVVETQKLGLELEESEDVISVTGNLTVTLTGYYINSAYPFTGNDNSLFDSRREDLAETESCKQSTNDSDEPETDTDVDSFINDSTDPEILTPSPKPKTKTQGKFSLRLTPKFPIERKRNKQRKQSGHNS